MRNLFSICWSEESKKFSKPRGATVVALGCLPEAESKPRLLKVPHTMAACNKEIKLELSLKPLPRGQAFIVWEALCKLL